MSETILVIVTVGENGTVTKQDLECVAFGRALGEQTGGTLSIGVIGGDTANAVNELKVLGAGRVYSVSGEAYAVSRYKTDICAAQAIAESVNATILLGATHIRWNRIAAGLAQRLGGVFDSQITGATAEAGAINIDRWYYRQRMKGTLSRTKRPWVLTVSAGSCEPAAATGNESEVVDLHPEAPVARTLVKGVQASAGDSQTIRPEAQILFVAGAGWTKKQADGAVHIKDAEELILGFLEKADASLGSSKSLVDLGSEGQAVLSFLTHLHQIGQTGATPRHPKGLSTCCHGEEPHAVGWRFINERRAISLDANCGWAHGKADVLYVADAFAVMKHVNAML